MTRGTPALIPVRVQAEQQRSQRFHWFPLRNFLRRRRKSNIHHLEQKKKTWRRTWGGKKLYSHIHPSPYASAFLGKTTNSRKLNEGRGEKEEINRIHWKDGGFPSFLPLQQPKHRRSEKPRPPARPGERQGQPRDLISPALQGVLGLPRGLPLVGRAKHLSQEAPRLRGRAGRYEGISNITILFGYNTICLNNLQRQMLFSII